MAGVGRGARRVPIHGLSRAALNQICRNAAAFWENSSMNGATQMRDTPQTGITDISPADCGRAARDCEDVPNVAAGRAAHGSSLVFDPRILLVLLSALLFVPVLALFYWPAMNGV